MRHNKRFLFLGLCAIAMICLLSGNAISAGVVTITGTVHPGYQIIADDGQVYNIAENDKGYEVSRNIGEKVKVTGTVEEDEGENFITVTSYEVIEEE